MIEQLTQFMSHHWELAGLFVVLIALLMVVETRGKVRGILQLSPQQLVDSINHHNATLVDIRDPNAYAAGHIVGAVSINPQALEDSVKKLKKQKSKLVVVYGSAVNQANQLAVKLRQSGFSEVKCLAGGLSAWQNAGFPLVKKGGAS